MIKESLEISIDTIKHRKTSSFLTILGIVIGISAIISLLSIGVGLEQSISEQLEGMGSDKIMVMPGSGSGFEDFSSITAETLTDEDVETIEDISGVKMAAGLLFKTLPVKYKDEVASVYVSGGTADAYNKMFLEMKVFEMNEGRTIKKGERGVAAIGYLIVDSVFDLCDKFN